MPHAILKTSCMPYKSNGSAALRRLQEEKDPLRAAAVWADELNGRERHFAVKQLFFTRHPRHPELAAAICDLIVARHLNVGLDRQYVRLLCLVLARTHDVRYLKHVVLLKAASTDMSATVDSNLLFEFSPGASRATCVRDTVDAAQHACDARATGKLLTGRDGFASIAQESWFDAFVAMANS